MNERKAPTPPAAARLHVLLARDAPFAVILRRGPSKQVCTIGWNLQNDTFKIGQWLKGRIYERECDLSPDGEHLLYHAVKYRIKDGGWLEYAVVSRAPYLKALKIWKGKGFYGGVFLSNDRFASHPVSFFDSAPLPKIFRVAPFGEVKNEAELAQTERPADTVQWRFQRDGWTELNALGVSSSVELIKESAGWELKLTVRGTYFSTKSLIYTVRGRSSGENFDCARWEWADFRGERLLWAQDGKIFAAKVWDGGHGPTDELADFNDWVFEPIVAPY